MRYYIPRCSKPPYFKSGIQPTIQYFDSVGIADKGNFWFELKHKKATGVEIHSTVILAQS